MSSPKESELRKLVVAALRQYDAISVENPVHPGTPDVNCSLGWIELKVLDELPKRAATPIRIPHFTAQQRVWLLRRWRCDQRAWLLVVEPRASEWFLFNGEIAAEHVGKLTLDEMRVSHIHAWHAFKPTAGEFSEALRKASEVGGAPKRHALFTA